ncbi:MAG: GGDEF domain-containing protein [Lachnospiraceae bacterium]|nr:GGDEF domain-containing protein [Lachnospiraceae bacterium]
MDYDLIVNGLNKIASVLSVQMNPDGSCGEICVEAANDIYLESVHVKREDFVPGKPYSCYVPPTRNYEDMSYRCVKENRLVHFYIHVGLYNAWMEVYMLPLKSEEADKGYYLFSYDMKAGPEAEKLADLEPEIAMKVLQITMKLRESADFNEGVDSVLHDIRLNCEAERCCILLTDFKEKQCSVLSADASVEETSDEDLKFLQEETFFHIVESWDKLIEKSNCYIIHDKNELETIKESNPVWYDSLKKIDAYSMVIYPLKANGGTIGYVWAINFNSDNTLRIKSILEITAFLLASEIANQQLLKKMKLLSDTDLLTGLLNRNAMNNRVTDIVTGEVKLGGKYGVIFVDLNGLKTVNDRDGHPAGDRLLKGTANLLKECFADQEIYRVGGDEFLILVTGCSEEEFNALADKLKKASEGSKDIRVALGTCFGDESLDIRTAMHLADERMYKDKGEFYRTHPEFNRRSRES